MKTKGLEVLDQLDKDLEEQRAADEAAGLEANKKAFADEKAAQKAAVDKLAQTDDSATSQKLIADAKAPY